jgi:hypothetical protein
MINSNTSENNIDWTFTNKECTIDFQVRLDNITKEFDNNINVDEIEKNLREGYHHISYITNSKLKRFFGLSQYSFYINNILINPPLFKFKSLGFYIGGENYLFKWKKIFWRFYKRTEEESLDDFIKRTNQKYIYKV